MALLPIGCTGTLMNLSGVRLPAVRGASTLDIQRMLMLTVLEREGYWLGYLSLKVV